MSIIPSVTSELIFSFSRLLESQRQIPRIWAIEREVARLECERLRDDAPVFFFNASTRILGLSQNAAFSLLASWALRLSGQPVKYFVCRSAMPQCMLGTLVDYPERNPPCKSCTLFSSEIFPAKHEVPYKDDSQHGRPSPQDLQGGKLEDLIHYEEDGLKLGEICLPSLRWALRRHTPMDDPVTRALLAKYIRGASQTARSFKAAIGHTPPAAVVVFNGQSFPEAVVRAICIQQGIRVITHEVGIRPMSVFFSHGEATAYSMDIPQGFRLSDSDNDRLDDYLSSRFRGDFTMAGIRFWPQMSGLGEDIMRLLAAYDQAVTVFTNVIFDTSQKHANVVFSDMFEWLDGVVSLARSHPKTLFIIRAHPDEIRPGKASRETVESRLRINGGMSLPNVLFIPPSDRISSYELISRSKFVMVYNSSIGLEASIMGAAVLCGGASRYTAHGVGFFQRTREEYYELAKRFIGADRIDVPNEHQANGRRLLFFHLYHASLDLSRFLAQVDKFPGQVRLRKFRADDLKPENCEESRIIQSGILEGTPFVYP